MSNRVLLFTFSSVSWIFWYSILKKAFVLHYYFSRSSKDSEETTAVDRFPVSLGLRAQSIRRKQPSTHYFTQTDWIKKTTYTTRFTVLRLMGANIFIKLAISNSIQLQKQHAPVYFCYLPHAPNNSKIFMQFINQSASFSDPFIFLALPQIFGTQKGNQAWLESTKCPPPNRCATQECQC